MKLSPITSQVKSWNGKKVHRWQPVIDGDLPMVGPNGGRIILDAVELVAEYQFDVGTAAWKGEDVRRLFGTFDFTQRDSVKRYEAIAGGAMRTMLYYLEGADRVEDYADVATGVDATGTIRAYLPLAKRFAVNGDDFACPVENIKEISINEPALADMTADTSAISNVDTLDYHLVYHIHEEDPDTIEFYAVDTIRAHDMTSASSSAIPINGRLMDAWAWKDAADGGADLSAFTAFRFGYVHDQDINVADVLPEYLRQRNARKTGATLGALDNTDPFAAATPIAIPLLFSGKKTSAWHGHELLNTKLTATNTVTSVQIFVRVVEPKSLGIARRYEAKYGIRPRDYRMKTAGKTKRGLGEWEPNERAYARWSARNPKYRRA